MRLDHLLSKEHWSRQRSRAWSDCECRSAGAQGWNIDYLALNSNRRCKYKSKDSGTQPAREQRLTRCWVLRARAKARPSGAGLRPAWTPPNDEPPPLAEGVDSKVGCRPYVENYTVDASIFVAQVFKGARWMPWHQEPKKDVGICDKPRGVDNQTVIRGFPNGETRLEASPVTPA